MIMSLARDLQPVVLLPQRPAACWLGRTPAPSLNRCSTCGALQCVPVRLLFASRGCVLLHRFIQLICACERRLPDQLLPALHFMLLRCATPQQRSLGWWMVHHRHSLQATKWTALMHASQMHTQCVR